MPVTQQSLQYKYTTFILRIKNRTSKRENLRYIEGTDEQKNIQCSNIWKLDISLFLCSSVNIYLYPKPKTHVTRHPS